MTYRYITDPGHGWIEVSRAEINRLCIEDQISNYSYQHADMVYLEEDCDATVFIRAKEARKEPVQYFEIHQENTFVRNLPRFQP